MFEVQIVYLSGKVELANIAISDYSNALKQLSDEGRLVSMNILKVL